jgi:protein TonB
MAATVARTLSRHGAIVASVAFHGAALAVLILKLTPPILTAPANAEIPAIAVEVITLPTPAPDLVTTAALPPPPPPEPEPVVVEEPPPVIESTVSETVAEPPPPPKVEEKPPEPPKPKPKHKPKPIKHPKPVERPPERVDTASVATPTPPVPAPPAPQTAMAAPVGRAGPPPSYLALLHSALERNKDYPRSARQRRQQGRAMLRFSIDRSGKVLRYKIEKSTGYDVLDREVIAMIQRASPLPPMPADMSGDHLEIVVPVPFTLR